MAATNKNRKRPRNTKPQYYDGYALCIPWSNDFDDEKNGWGHAHPDLSVRIDYPEDTMPDSDRPVSVCDHITGLEYA